MIPHYLLVKAVDGDGYRTMHAEFCPFKIPENICLGMYPSLERAIQEAELFHDKIRVCHVCASLRSHYEDMDYETYVEDS